MKYLAIAILLAALMLASSMAFASAAPGNQATGYDNFDLSHNGISNFTVRINNQAIVVFRYFNISGSTQFLNIPNVNENRMVPISWHGFGNVSIVPAISFSSVGSFNYSSIPVQYLYLYKSDYIGVILTTGQISESGGQIFINAVNSLTENSVELVNSPISDYNFTQNSYQAIGHSYKGNYSSFSYSSGSIVNFSLINEESSVQIISSISSSKGLSLSMNTAGVSTADENGVFASDGLFPMVYLNGFDTAINITLANGFRFWSSGERPFHGGDGNGNNVRSEDHSGIGSIQMPEQQIFKIVSGHRTVGYVDVYGKTTLNNTTLSVNSPMSFVVVRFLPSFKSAAGENHSNDDLGNATTAIYVDNGTYFVPFSPNVTAQNLSFNQNTLTFDFIQNGTQDFVIVMQGNFSVSAFSFQGPGQNNSHYSVSRTSNQTIISFSTNGSGQGSLSLSVAPVIVQPNHFSLIVLVVSATSIVVVAGSLIIYSRRRWVKELEKE
ncbi:MAG: hypothetical protein ACP5UZ_06670 [Thermoplasmata archaeon]